MTLSSALSNAYSGLVAASRGAGVVSDNVANALTPGHTRREVQLAGGTGPGIGTGVRVAAITRAEDPLASALRRSAGTDLGYRATLSLALGRMADALGMPGQPGALAARAAALENALSLAAQTPDSATLQEGAVIAARDLAQAFGAVSGQTAAVRMSADAAIADQVRSVNDALRQVQALNAEIRLRRSSGDLAALQDQRQRLIDDVSRIVPIRQVQREGGELALYTAGGAVLLDGGVHELGFAPTPVITPDMTLASGALSGLTLNGRDLAIGTGTGAGQLDGGSLSALFELRDVLAPRVSTQADLLALDLIERFADPGVDPGLLPGQPGLFTDAGGGPPLPADLAGLAGRIAVNTAVLPEAGGAHWRLRDGLNAAAPGAVGDDAQIWRLHDAMTALRSPHPDTGLSAQAGVAGMAAALTGLIAASAARAETETAATAARHAALQEAELAATGVDTDAQMQALLLIEQAYAANARVISVVDDMLKRLLEI